jgi:hypothetical protein
MKKLPMIVFDVNETLLDLDTMTATGDLDRWSYSLIGTETSSAATMRHCPWRRTQVSVQTK